MSESSRRPDGARIGPDRTLADLVDELDDRLAVVEDRPPVTLDTVLETLADPGRRYVLSYLLLIDRPVSTAELVDYVANEIDAGNRADRFRSEVAAELVEVQLPKLEKSGFIDYNRERQLIGETDRTRLTLPFLHLGREYARRQSESD
jgi:hypothetical protein